MAKPTARTLLVLSSLIAALGGVALLRTSLVQSEWDFSQRNMQHITTTWTSSGVSHSVTTARAEQETVEQMMQRHQELVEALQAQYPPD